MNTLPIDLYKIIENGLGGDTWQEFIDRYNEKYDLVQIDASSLMRPSWIIPSLSSLRVLA
ncbi:hypothetical protein JCM6292_2114 [Bacteroides pyogenes JCM 6292]|uniref:Uncharacterized protein n=1 Tax=Bacteroides pyogenes JCM 6292 TaxID=1235809 RepID=W4P9C6_9BACE|nr:hypothetical protein JCM6292_2114 [Bacteroides pyogenes JCM 6292]